VCGSPGGLSISNSSALLKYANDIVLYKPNFSALDISGFPSDVDLICAWVDFVHLRWNAKKTKSMLVSRKHVNLSLQLVACGEQVEQVRTFQHLGVWFSDDLSWSAHIASVCVKAKQRLAFIFRTFGQADARVLSRLYQSLVLLLPDYCDCV